MEAVLLPDALKTFAKILQCLNKIGPELHLEVRNNKFQLSALNQSKSAFTMFNFSPHFFRTYRTVFPHHDHPTAPPLNCRIPLPPLCSILRTKISAGSTTTGHGAGPHLGKAAVEQCRLILATGDPETDASLGLDAAVQGVPYLMIQLDHGLPTDGSAGPGSKVFRLYVGDLPDPPHAVYAKQKSANHWATAPGNLVAVVPHFHPKTEELTLEHSAERVVLRAVPIEGTSADDPGVLSTSVRLETGDFEPYAVGAPVGVTFSLREFKAILGLADYLQGQVQAYFDGPGHPMIFSIQTDGFFACDFVLATVQEDAAAAAAAAAAATTQPANTPATAAFATPPSRAAAAAPAGPQAPPPPATPYRAPPPRSETTSTIAVTPPRPTAPSSRRSTAARDPPPPPPPDVDPFAFPDPPVPPPRRSLRMTQATTATAASSRSSTRRRDPVPPPPPPPVPEHDSVGTNATAASAAMAFPFHSSNPGIVSPHRHGAGATRVVGPTLGSSTVDGASSWATTVPAGDGGHARGRGGGEDEDDAMEMPSTPPPAKRARRLFS
ncbi:cell cycle checkpoint control protein rad9a [Allomyces javanicus]|nr:cell cycle checkpoint control protein rad9a [Allomyces javanicus]